MEVSWLGPTPCPHSLSMSVWRQTSFPSQFSLCSSWHRQVCSIPDTKMNASGTQRKEPHPEMRTAHGHICALGLVRPLGCLCYQALGFPHLFKIQKMRKFDLVTENEFIYSLPTPGRKGLFSLFSSATSQFYR